MEHKPEYKFKLDLASASEQENEKYSFIDCPNCGNQVNATGINLNQLIATCNSCNALFSVEEDVAKLKTKVKLNQEFDQPVEVEKFYFGNELDLSVSQSISGLEGIAAYLFPFLALMGGLLYYKGKITFIFPLICLIIFAVGLISLINLKKHRTQIKVTEDDVIVENRPKKLRKDKRFNSRDINQLYVFTHPNASDGSTNYGLKIVVDGVEGQTHQQLLKGLKTLREAKFIEQEIEKHLKIVNKKMLEEV